MRNESVARLTALVLVACLLGGGGVAYGLNNLLVQLAAIALLALHGDALSQFLRQGPRFLVILVVATLALPLLQLVPLPEGMWSGLPGRDLVVQALNAAGATGWRPATVSVARTFVAFLGLLAPLVVVILGLRSDGMTLSRVAQVFIAVGAASVLLGAAQVLGQPGTAQIYPESPDPGVMVGFFANRNSTAIFLVCCLILVCGGPPRRVLSVGWMAMVSAGVLLAVGVVMTQSRTGLALLALPLALGVLRLVVNGIESRSRADRERAGGRPGQTAMFAALAAATVLVAVAAGSAITQHSRLELVFSRFDRTGEQRPAIWEDARFAAQRYWPVGAGMGTFDEVFQTDESLENITPRRAGRAHNDYIEIAIEAGLAGLALVAMWAIWVLSTAWSAIGSPRRWEALSGAGILLAIALQSLLDYPLRNQTMLCLAAFAVVLLVTAHGRRSPASSGKEPTQ